MPAIVPRNVFQPIVATFAVFVSRDERNIRRRAAAVAAGFSDFPAGNFAGSTERLDCSEVSRQRNHSGGKIIARDSKR